MARPTKIGLDYFSIDCIPDTKLELFILENGMKGYGILITIWQMIYYNDGYYITYNDDLSLMVKKRTLEDTETIINVINNAVKRGLFDGDMLENYGVLTSAGIQKRYFPAAHRKRKIQVISEYLLIDVSEFKNIISACINPVNAGNNPVNANTNATNVNVDVNVKEKEELIFPAEIPINEHLNTLFNKEGKKMFSEESGAFAEWFLTLMPESLHPTKTDLLNWAKAYDEILQHSGRTDEEIRKVCRWARDHPIWREHFLNPRKLLTKDNQGISYFDKFLIGMNNQNQNSHDNKQGSISDKRKDICARSVDRLLSGFI